MNKNEIRFSHFRKNNSDNSIATKGGATIAYLPVGDKLFAAVAYCSPRDNFCYGSGRLKSSARLAYLVDHPEHATVPKNEDKYFVIDMHDNNISRAVSTIRDHMVDGLGYRPRYGQEKQEATAAG